MIDVNIKGHLYGIAAALPLFREQRSTLRHLASTVAYVTSTNQPVYSGTKHAVVAIAEGLRKALPDPTSKSPSSRLVSCRPGSWKLSRTRTCAPSS